MFNKILIANRGEIACRIIKTAKRLGLSTVAIFSDADKNALHTQLADEAYYIGNSPSRESYLAIEKIIAVAKAANVDAIHPGYGFLSENSAFAAACEQAQIIFIGPPAAAIQAMGSKSTAKQLMENAGVPLIQGYHGDEQDLKFLSDQAKKIGYPVILKAAAGGGGKGMRVVTEAKQFNEALQSAKREAMASFGNDKMLIEKYIGKPRHIEIQVFADKHGHAIYLFERDCSTQRRYQKIIEEAPAAKFTPELRSHMGQAAILATQAIDYVGAGTVEFLLDEQHNFYFMEMNTRLQVEHPVTEMITGLDLVEWQLRIAANEKLPLTQEQISLHGHAIELRVYAEDPYHQFLPSTGTIYYLNTPKQNEHVRLDSGIIQGSVVSPYYDPMLAKLIVWHQDRDSAIRLLRKQLDALQIAGVKTNINFLCAVLDSAAFKQANIDTGYIDKYLETIVAVENKVMNEAFCLASLQLLLMQTTPRSDQAIHSPWRINDGWRLNLISQQQLYFNCESQKYCITIQFIKDQYIFTINNTKYNVSNVNQDRTHITAVINNIKFRANIVMDQNHNHLDVFIAGKQHHLEIYNPLSIYESDDQLSHSMSAPMPGTVVAILTEVGKTVARGENLLVIEAMKMEHTIQAPVQGIVKEILYTVGDMVDEGTELLTFEATVVE